MHDRGRPPGRPGLDTGRAACKRCRDVGEARTVDADRSRARGGGSRSRGSASPDRSRRPRRGRAGRPSAAAREAPGSLPHGRGLRRVALDARRRSAPVRGRGGTAVRLAEELLAGAELDAVAILTSGSHGALAAAAARAGLAVFCEKPLAYTLAEADELAALEPRLMLGYMKLYDPAVEHAHRLLADRPAARSVEVTVLHPSSAAQLAHASLLPPPERRRPGGLARPSRRTRAAVVERALGPVPDALATLYTDVLLGSVVHDLAVIRYLLGGPLDVRRRRRLARRREGLGRARRDASPAERASRSAGITSSTIRPTARRCASTTTSGTVALDLPVAVPAARADGADGRRRRRGGRARQRRTARRSRRSSASGSRSPASSSTATHRARGRRGPRGRRRLPERRPRVLAARQGIEIGGEAGVNVRSS